MDLIQIDEIKGWSLDRRIDGWISNSEIGEMNPGTTKLKDKSWISKIHGWALDLSNRGMNSEFTIQRDGS